MTFTISSFDLHVAILSSLVEVLCWLLYFRHRQRRAIKIEDTPWPTLNSSVTDRSHSTSVTGVVARADHVGGSRIESSERSGMRRDQ